MKAEFYNEGAALDESVMFCNSQVDADGWAQLAPFGDYPGVAYFADGRKMAAVQRFSREACDEMVRCFKEPKSSRFSGGVDIFNGHPDKIGSRETPVSQGVISDLEVRETGLFGRPVFNPAGEALLAGTTKLAFSVRVSTVPVSEDPPIFQPNVLRSVGVTPRPNLPVEFLNSATGATKDSTMNKEKIIALLAKFGVTAPPTAGEDELMALLEKQMAGKAEVCNEKAALEAKVTSLTAEVCNSRQALETERKTRVESALANAVTAGQITEAEKPKWQRRLEADFANESADLAALPPKVKTQAQSGAVGSQKPEFANEFEQAVAAGRKEGKTRTAAIAAARTAHPQAHAAWIAQGGKL